jgi:hypothetical protein
VGEVLLTDVPSPVVPVDPTWFDWLAQIIIPTLLGLGTLAVGIAAIVVAVQAHHFAKAARTEDTQRTEQAGRMIAARQYAQWRDHDAFITSYPGTPAARQHHERLKELRQTIELGGHEGLSAFVTFTTAQAQRLVGEENLSRRGRMIALHQMVTDTFLAEWVRDPVTSGEKVREYDNTTRLAAGADETGASK